jgi:isopenicillin N synthase-like dioxygenase
MLEAVADACKDWGFFQVVNHDVDMEVVKRMRGAWREFFDLPMEEKKVYANLPVTYEGYGSRLGVEKEAILDWNDYYFLNLFPSDIRNLDKWPKIPTDLRLVDIYQLNYLFCNL